MNLNSRSSSPQSQNLAAAVPRNELRRIAIDAVEKTTDQLGLAVSGLTERPDAESAAFAQAAGDGDDALQVQGQKIAASRRPPLLRGPGPDLGVRQGGGKAIEPTQSRDVGHRLDVEDEGRRHWRWRGARGANARRNTALGRENPAR